MGTQLIIASGSSFKSSGRPSVNPAVRYCDEGEITDVATRAAIRTLYNNLRDANLWAKMDGIFLFTGKASSDRLNFRKIELGSLNFVGDAPGLHTKLLGYQPSETTTSYATTPDGLVKADLNDSHVHVFNTTAEESGASANRVLLAATRTVNYQIELNRNRAGKTAIYNGLNNPTPLTSNTLSTSATGLLSGVRRRTSLTATELALFSSGVKDSVRTTDGIINASLSVPAPFHIGHKNNQRITQTALRLVAWGFNSWSDADESSFNTIVSAFNASLLV